MTLKLLTPPRGFPPVPDPIDFDKAQVVDRPAAHDAVVFLPFPDDPHGLNGWYIAIGSRQECIAWLEQLRVESARQRVHPFSFATCQTCLGSGHSYDRTVPCTNEYCVQGVICTNVADGLHALRIETAKRQHARFGYVELERYLSVVLRRFEQEFRR